jgi:type II secretory pathway pseudopilin PulG
VILQATLFCAKIIVAGEIIFLRRKTMTKQTNSAIDSLCFKMLHRFYNSFISTKKLQASSQQGGRFLPICAKDTPHFWSEVYKVGTRARKVQVDLVQGGRSMIEMLGVLAIIGVLSVGGIAGYTKAMNTYKINNTLNDYNHIITTILQQGHKAWKLTSEVYITSDMLDAVGLLPNNWTIQEHSDNIFYDDLHNTVTFRSIENSGSFPRVLSVALNSGGSNWTKDTKQYVAFCSDFITKFLKPRSNEILQLTSWSAPYYGDSMMGCQYYPSMCVRNITPVMAQKLCKYPYATASLPSLTVDFKFAF